MKSGGKTGVFFVFLLFLILFGFIGSVNAEELKKFDANNPATWSYDLEQFRKLSVEQISKFPEEFKKLADKSTIEQRNGFAGEQIKEKIGFRIKTENLGHADLKWSGNKLTDDKGRILDMDNLPVQFKSDFKGIKYEPEKGFIFETDKFNLKNSLTVSKGGYGEDGFYGTESLLDGAKWNEKGDFVQDFQNKIGLNNRAELDVKNGDSKINYRQRVKTEEGFFEIISNSRSELTNAEARDSKNGIIGAGNIATLAVFDDNPVDSQQYARIGSKEINFYGEKIDIETKKPLDKVKGTGIGDYGISVFDGKDVEIKFKGEKTIFSKTVRSAPYSIKQIINEKDPNMEKNTISIQNTQYVEEKDKNGGIILKRKSVDEEGNGGSFLMTNNKVVAVGSHDFEWKLGTLGKKYANVGLYLNEGYIDDLPDNLKTREEFDKAVKDYQNKILTVRSLIDLNIQSILFSSNQIGRPSESDKIQLTIQDITTMSYSVGDLAIKYPKEFTHLIGVLGLVNGPSLHTIDKNNYVGEIKMNSDFQLDARTGTLTVLIPRTLPESRFIPESERHQYVYPKEFVNGLINQISGLKFPTQASGNENPIPATIINKGWNQYKKKYPQNFQ